MRRTEYIRSLASLRLDVELWIKDRQFIEQGGQIYYAVDTDTVKLFTNPANNITYAKVFPEENIRTDEILAFAVGEYIFNRLTDETPLLIIPPYDLEIERVAFAVAQKAMNEDKIRNETVPKILKQCKSKRKRPDEFISCLKEDPLDAILSYSGGKRSAFSELERIKNLLMSKRILHIERYIEKKWVFPILHEDDPEDYRRLKDLSAKWKDLLKSKKSKWRSDIIIETDARVLANLEWINKEVRTEGKRLILISGDESMREAASGYKIDGESFASLFIRNPRIYLAIPDFLCFEEKKVTSRYEKGLLQWIEVFFAEYGLRDRNYPYNLQDLVNKKHKLVKDADETLKELRKQWEEFISYVGVSYIPLEKLAEKFAKHTLQDIKRRVEERQQDTLRSFWSTITVTSYSNLNIRKITKELPLRGLPSLRFTLPVIESNIKQLTKTADKKIVRALSENTEEFFRRFVDIDRSGYTAFIYFALAFAAIGRWYAAIALAKHALYIADHEAPKHKLPDGHEPITGSEAAYLLAWAARHNVEFPKGLNKCKKLLKEAGIRKEKATGDKSDIRFEAELVIIDIIYHFFDLFSANKREKTDNVAPIEDCYDRLLDLIKRSDKERDEYVKTIIKKQLYSYLFYLFFVRKEKLGEDLSFEKDNITKYLTDFESILNIKGVVTRTCFTYPVYLCIKYYISENQTIKDRLKEYFNKFYEKYREKCRLMPYDDQLYSFLKRLYNG